MTNTRQALDQSKQALGRQRPCSLGCGFRFDLSLAAGVQVVAEQGEGVALGVQ
jgi:hypothetical protein